MSKVLEVAKKRFKLAEDAWSKNREDAIDDVKFSRLGEQWPEDIKRRREQDGRPCLTINRLPAFIRQVVNDARLNSPSIKVMPVDDYSDPETAEIVNSLIRNIETTSNADVAYDSALENAVTCGFGYFRIDIDYANDDAFDLDLKIERIANPTSVYFDPHSVAVDASDWGWCFIEETMSKEEFKHAYPNADVSNWDGNDTLGWVNEDSVRVAEYWVREEVDTELLLLSNDQVIHSDQYEENKNLFDAQQLEVVKSRESKTWKVKQYVISGAEVLDETDWPGRYIPIIPVFGDEIIIEDKRYFQSLVRQSKDSQRNFNYWRSAATESLGLRSKMPWMGPVGAFDTDMRKWETANVEAHPFIEYDGQVQPTRQQPGVGDLGAIQEAAMSSDDLKSIMGLYDASLGQRSNETSGVAIKARQREGDVSTFHFIDNLSRAIKYAGRVLLDLIPHVYNTPRVLRVIGYDKTPETVKINQEFVVNGMTKIHDLTAGKYDLVVDTGPSFSTKREEAATQMTELLRAFPDAAPIIGDLVAKSLDWPGADEIAKRLKAMLPQQIKDLDEMDGLPPEAQSAIAQAEQKAQELMSIIEQGKQLLQEKEAQIKELEATKNMKDREISVKDMDSLRDYQVAMAKIEADKEIAQRKIAEVQREMILDVVTEFFSTSMQNNSGEYENVQL